MSKYRVEMRAPSTPRSMWVPVYYPGFAPRRADTIDQAVEIIRTAALYWGVVKESVRWSCVPTDYRIVKEQDNE